MQQQQQQQQALLPVKQEPGVPVKQEPGLPGGAAARPPAEEAPRDKVLGVSFANNAWVANAHLALNERHELIVGSRNGRARSMGAYKSWEEAAVARDVSVAWRQLKNNAALGAALRQYNLPLASLESEVDGLRASLLECSTVLEMRILLRDLRDEGRLAAMAGSLRVTEEARLHVASKAENAGKKAQQAAAAAKGTAAAGAAAPAARGAPARAGTQQAAPRLQQRKRRTPGAPAGNAAQAPAPAVAAAAPAQKPRLLYRCLQLFMGPQPDPQPQPGAARATAASAAAAAAAAAARGVPSLQQIQPPAADSGGAGTGSAAATHTPPAREAELRSEQQQQREERGGQLRRPGGGMQEEGAGGAGLLVAVKPEPADASFLPDALEGQAALPGRAKPEPMEVDAAPPAPGQAPAGAAPATAARPAVRPPMRGAGSAARRAAEAAPAARAARDARSAIQASDAALAALVAAGCVRVRAVQASSHTTFHCQAPVPLDGRGALSAGCPTVPKITGGFKSRSQAALARDLMMCWRVLGTGGVLADAAADLIFPPDVLERQAALLDKVKACAHIDALRNLLHALCDSWELQQALEAVLAACDGSAAAAAARQYAVNAKRPRSRAAQRPRGSPGGSREEEEDEQPPPVRRRVQQQQQQPPPPQQQQQEQQQQQAGPSGAATQQAAAGPSSAGQAAQEAAAAGNPLGPSAVGRRVNVWLTLGGGVMQQEAGRVAEIIPSGKHHIVFDDGEEAIMDLSEQQFDFISPPLSPADAQAVAAAAAAMPMPREAMDDMGQLLRVFWPDDVGGGDWWEAVCTYVTRTGLHCVHYLESDSEMLLDVLSPPDGQIVEWARADRQRSYRAELRAVRSGRQPVRQAAPLAPPPPPRQQQQRQQPLAAPRRQVQQQQPRQAQQPQQQAQQAALQGNNNRPQQGASSQQDADQVFFELAHLVGRAEAQAAGFTPNLLGQYGAISLPRAEQAAQDVRLRAFIDARNWAGIAALMQATVDRALQGLAA